MGETGRDKSDVHPRGNKPLLYRGLSVHHFLPYFILYSLLSLMVDVTVSLPMCISTRVIWHHQSSEKDGTY